MMTSVSFGGAAACEWKGKAVVNARRNAMTISNFFFNAWLLSSDDLGLFFSIISEKAEGWDSRIVVLFRKLFLQVT